MANSIVVSNIIKTLSGFTVGVAVTTGLHTFNGTDALNSTKSNVVSYVQDVQDSMSELEKFASSNKSISDANNQAYQQALSKANNNINQLISHINNMTLSESELQNKVNQYESDIAELKTTIDGLQANVDAQVQSQVNEVITKANKEIDKANSEVETTTSAIDTALSNGAIDTSNITSNNSIQSVSQEQLKVTDISSIVGGSSQTPTTPQEPSQTPTTPQEPSVQEPTTTPQPDTSETGKSEETPSLYITGYTTEDDVKIYNEFNMGANYRVYTYTFSDGKQWEVTKYDDKVSMFNLVDNFGYSKWRSANDSRLQESEFIAGGYMDLINNYQN